MPKMAAAISGLLVFMGSKKEIRGGAAPNLVRSVAAEVISQEKRPDNTLTDSGAQWFWR
jgi:hypothetical protein